MAESHGNFAVPYVGEWRGLRYRRCGNVPHQIRRFDGWRFARVALTASDCGHLRRCVLAATSCDRCQSLLALLRSHPIDDNTDSSIIKGYCKRFKLVVSFFLRWCGGCEPHQIRRSECWRMAEVTLPAVRRVAADNSAFGNDGNLLKMVKRRGYTKR